MIRRLIPVVAAAALLCGAGVMAQGSGGAPPPPPPHGWGGRGGPGPGGFAFGGFAEMAGGRTVTGAPVSSTITVTHTQKLADGNTITTTSNTEFARDTSGRVSREVTLPAIGPLSASGSTPHLRFITDPVAGTNVTMDMNRKTAQQFPFHPRRQVSGDVAQRPFNGSGRNGGKGENRPNVTTQSLGTKVINGVNAEGTLVTHTIPAGRMGNSAPIVTTTERWFSPDLHMVVSETRTDPRFGTTTMQMTNVNRSEPDASLFTVPADYTVKQGRPMGHGRRGAAPPQP